MGLTRRTEAYRIISPGASDKALVLCIDYHCSGRLTGSRESGLITNAIPTVRWAFETARIPSSCIVLLSQSLHISLASSAACYLTSQGFKIEFAVFVFAQRSAMPYRVLFYFFGSVSPN